MVVFAADAYAQPDKAKGPKIVLEDEEVTLLENGKEIKNIRLNSSSEERKAIRKSIDEKVLKKLGVKTLKEVNEKRLAGKFNEEAKKLIRVKHIKFPPLRFIDEKGKEIKRISLKPETFIEEINQGEWKKLKRDITYGALISRKGKYAIVGANKNILAAIDEEGNENMEGEGTGSFSLYDAAGKVLWKKEFPVGRIGHFESSEMLISDNAEIIAVETSDTTGMAESESGEGIDQITYVYDKQGRELLRIPAEGEEKKIWIATLNNISPNGRYLAVNVALKLEEPPYQKTITRFYDLKKNRFWDAKERYDVRSITSNGMALVGFFEARRGLIKINLKDTLGK